MIVCVAVVVLAVVGRVIATDLRPRFVNSAAIVVLKVATHRMNEQVPGFVLDKNRRLFVKQIPSDIFKVCKSFGRVDWQSEVPAALGRAVIAQIFARRQVFAFYFGSGKSVHRPLENSSVPLKNKLPF